MSSIVENQLPWLNTRLGFVGRWFRTIGWSMSKPAELGKVIPREVFLPALKFFLITTAVASTFGLIPSVMLDIVPDLAKGGVGMGMVMNVMSSLLIPVIVVLYILIEGLIAHAALKLTGGCTFGLGQTMTGVFFGSGPYILLGVPCLSVCFIPVVLIWCIVVKSIILSHLQQVSVPRGIVAISASPFMILIAALGAAYMTVNV
jgi:hypothetical protein